MAMIKTSFGISTISSPFKENITAIVNNKAINVMGEMRGKNFSVYQVSPLELIKEDEDVVVKKEEPSITTEQKEEIKESVPKRVCPEGKEYNKRTKRCVKKCKEGSRRNENFRCVKIPKSKTQKKKKRN